MHWSWKMPVHFEKAGKGHLHKPSLNPEYGHGSGGSKSVQQRPFQLD